MAYRLIRMRGANKSAKSFDILFPQTVTANVMRDDSGGILEQSLVQYDRHLGNTLIHVNRALSSGTASALFASCPGVMLVDNLPLLLELHVDLEMEPTLSFNGAAPAPIVTSDGNSIPGGQIAGSSLFLVWNARHKKWYMMNNDRSAAMTRLMIPSEMEYVHVIQEFGERVIVIPSFDRDTDKLVVNYNQTILRPETDYIYVGQNAIEILGIDFQPDEILSFTITKFTEVVRKGSYSYELSESTTIFEAPDDHTTIVPLPQLNTTMYSMTLNYNQTILRNGLDYKRIGDRSIQLFFELNKGDQIMFTIVRYVEKNGTLQAMTGNAGNYRYAINVLHESFTADYDETAKIIVPNYNRLRDDLSVIYKNHLLVRDVDYVVDELNNIILMTKTLSAGETIYFTIMQGAMIDVPKFNLAEAYGDGKDIKVNISHAEIHDFYTLLLRLNVELKDSPTVKCVDGPAEPIVDSNGHPINGGNLPGSYLMLVQNTKRRCWYCLGGIGESNSTLPKSGEANFPGQIIIPSEPVQEWKETVVHHGLGHKPEHVRVFPCEPPTIVDGVVQYIGDVWAYADEENLYVGNTGTSTSKFHWEVSDVSLSDTISFVDQLDARIDSFSRSLSDFENRIEKVEHFEEHVEQFEEHIDEFERHAVETSRQFDAVEDRMNDIEQSYNDHESVSHERFSNINDSIDDINAEVKYQSRELRRHINDFEDHVEDAESRLDNIERQL